MSQLLCHRKPESTHRFAPSDPSLLERRPLAIKVANYPRYIRPQSGLTLADNIFEYYIEAV